MPLARNLRPLIALVTLVACVAAVFVDAVTVSGEDSRADRSRGIELQRVFIIMLENHSEQSVIGNPNAPFITQLAETYGQATQYFGVTHPSEPNYIAATSGSNWWVNNDNPANVFDHTNIVDQLEAAHISWAAYMEAMPSVGFTGSQWPSYTALYANKHNPFVLYRSVLNDPARLSRIKPYKDLVGDLKGPNPARYIWISPDQCNDMHGGASAVPGFAETPCPYSNDAQLKANADNFVKNAVATIMSSQAWTRHSAIFIVADEGDFTGNSTNGGWGSTAGCCDSPVAPAHDPDISAAWPGGTYGGGPVPAIVIDPSGPRHFVDSTPYNHYSLLRTIEDAWGLPELAYAGDHAQVPAMNSFLSDQGESS